MWYMIRLPFASYLHARCWYPSSPCGQFRSYLLRDFHQGSSRPPAHRRVINQFVRIPVIITLALVPFFLFYDFVRREGSFDSLSHYIYRDSPTERCLYVAGCVLFIYYTIDLASDGGWG